MKIFPPENALEFLQAHAEINFFVLGRLMVFFKSTSQSALAKRRNSANDGLPFDNGKPRMGKPRDAADDDHGKYQSAASKQPDGNGFLHDKNRQLL